PQLTNRHANLVDARENGRECTLGDLVGLDCGPRRAPLADDHAGRGGETSTVLVVREVPLGEPTDVHGRQPHEGRAVALPLERVFPVPGDVAGAELVRVFLGDAGAGHAGEPDTMAVTP